MIKPKIITPKKKLPDAAAIQRVIDNVLDNAAYDAISLFEDTTRTWKNRPNFYMRKLRGSRSVGTKSKIYQFVDKGTRAHVIKPKRAGGVLRFRAGGFKAKTTPGRLQSNKGVPARNWTSAKIVRHPGTEARGFSEEIQKRMQKQIASDMRKAMKGLLK